MKILIILDKSFHTSFGRVADSFYQALESDHDVKMLYLSSPQYFNEGEVENCSKNIELTSPSFLLGRFYWVVKLPKVLKEENPDWVLIIRPELSFLLPSIKRFCPNSKSSIMVHDTFAETLYPNSLKFKLINSFYTNKTTCADGIIYNSKYTKNESHKYFNNIRVDCVESICGCVIDRQIFKKLDLSKIELRKKWNLYSEHIFLNISLDEPRKNILSFLKLALEFPQALFIRIGKLSPWIKEFIEINEIVNVLHYQNLTINEIVEAYNLVDVFIYPSYLEGFGLPPLEALSCGTPTITAGTSALKENLEGYIPQVFPADDIKKYVLYVKELFSEPQKTDWDEINSRLNDFAMENFKLKVQKHLKLTFLS